MTDRQLLQQYVRRNSQAAFSQIVTRHLNFVYSVCRRETGDAALAEDITQVVFLILARKASSVRVETSLSGWLFQTACFAAKNAWRREASRKRQEQAMEEETIEEHLPLERPSEIWNQIEPHYNSALAALSVKDREAVLLRFADGLSFPELSQALGTSEDAARMRLNRAISRLRQSFAHAGITVSIAVLAGLLAERTVQAAPAACAVKMTGAASRLNPRVHLHLQGALKAMTFSKLKVAAVLALGTAAVVSVPFVTRAQNSARPLKATLSPIAQPSLVSISGQAVLASNASLLALNKLQLTQPFTLRYTAATKDVTTPAMWEAETKMLKHSYEVMAENGATTQAVADEQIQRIGAGKTVQSPPFQFDITLSFDGSRLFYQKTEPGHNLFTVICDGKKTYNYETSNHSMTISPGLKFGQMFSCPIPGVGLPQVPLLQASSVLSMSQSLLIKGDVLSTGVGGKPIYYERGAIALAEDHDSKEVAAMTLFYYEQNFPTERWEFQSHRSFQGMMIASEIRYIRYAASEGTPVDAPNTKPWPPETTTEYHLQSASDVPVDATQFDPALLMAPGDQVYENTSQGFSAYRWKIDKVF